MSSWFSPFLPFFPETEKKNPPQWSEKKSKKNAERFKTWTTVARHLFFFKTPFNEFPLERQKFVPKKQHFSAERHFFFPVPISSHEAFFFFCWCVDDCVDVLMIVLMCWWCVDVMMCWYVDVLMYWCIDVLMCWCWCVDVLRFDVLMLSVDDCVLCWCVTVCWRVDVIMCWGVDNYVDMLMCWQHCVRMLIVITLICMLMSRGVELLRCCWWRCRWLCWSWCVGGLMSWYVGMLERWHVDVLRCVDVLISWWLCRFVAVLMSLASSVEKVLVLLMIMLMCRCVKFMCWC